MSSHAVEQPLRILFLDDFSERSEEFLALVPHGHWVETAADCIASVLRRRAAGLVPAVTDPRAR